MAKHERTVSYRAGLYQPECSCGWVGRSYSHKGTAEREAMAHEDPIATLIDADECICEGRVRRPRPNCWAYEHDLKEAR